MTSTGRSQLSIASSLTSTRSCSSLPVVRTNAQEADRCNLAFADFVYSSGTHFNAVEHPSFIQMCARLRPGYSPPKRRKRANEYLNVAYSKLKDRADDMLRMNNVGRTGPHHFTLVTDGWKNIRGDAIVDYVLVSPEG